MPKAPHHGTSPSLPMRWGSKKTPADPVRTQPQMDEGGVGECRAAARNARAAQSRQAPTAGAVSDLRDPPTIRTPPLASNRRSSSPCPR